MGDPEYTLEIELDGAVEREVPVGFEPVLLGRGGRNDVVLTDDLVSARHCAFWRRDRRLWVRDLGSRTGTRRDGRWIEQLGYYDPMRDPFELKVNLERVDYWLSVGAQPTETVGRLIQRARTTSVETASAEA